MTLIRCPECGREISDLARACPGCGLRSKYFRANQQTAPTKTESNTSRHKPVQALQEVLELFPDIQNRCITDPVYCSILLHIFSSLQNASLHMCAYQAGFLGKIPESQDIFHCIYVSLLHPQEGDLVTLRVRKLPKGYHSFSCNSILDVDQQIPLAITSMGGEVETIPQEDAYYNLPDQYVSQSDAKKLGISGVPTNNHALDLHNAKWIEQNLLDLKPYFDSILARVDPVIQLDEEQRRAVLTDEDYSLIVAGAGAGKTTTMAAKVKYLVDQKKVKPERILVVSLTNKAVDELKDRINQKLGIPAIIATFHRFGLDIIRKATASSPNIHYHPTSIITDLMENLLLKDPVLLRRILYFFSYYFEVPEDAMKFESLEQYHFYKASQDLLTLRSNLNQYNRQVLDIRSKRNRTCQGEYLRSYQEVQIANFLYMNHLEYEYEAHYNHPLPDLTKQYTPDFHIRQGDIEVYLEHFGIHENGTSFLYNQAQLSRYQSRIQDKRKIHREFGTQLIETYAEYRDGRSLLHHLQEVLVRAGFTLVERSDEEVYQRIIETSKDKYIYRFSYFMADFISRFKTNGFENEDFNLLRQKTDNVRTLLFLDIVQEVYLAYQAELRNRNSVDFDDMINNAEKILAERARQSKKLPFDYIIIDEYQDISLQRFNLAKRLADVSDARIVAVGDDWQSIFAFAGSDITLFTRFLQLMGSGKELKITHTYRNSQELIDAAGSFIQKNTAQIRKKLLSPRKLQNPIEVILYEDTYKVLEHRAKAIVKAVGDLFQEFGRGKSILLIGRYNFDVNNICRTPYFTQITETKIQCNDYPEADLTFLTAHSSKGLGFDNVILINTIDHKFGFPCQIEDDPIMKLVIHEDKTLPFAEERRLFYVAMTRTKNRLMIIAPQSHPSRFLVELVNEHGVPCKELHSFVIDDTWKLGLRCPDCGFPLRYEPFKKSIGLPLYICTNEPEMCDFMTNSRECLVDIKRCKKCNDGYLIVKKKRNENAYILGCTSYNDGTGCRHVENITVLDNLAPK